MYSGSNINKILLIRKLFIFKIKIVTIERLVRCQYKKEKGMKNGRESTGKS